MEPLTISVSEACAMLGIKKTKFYELVSNREIDSCTIGRRRLVKVASLKALIGEGAK